ncbi:uncharacterized protein V6R79_017381 [Siganus canaliculatus]
MDASLKASTCWTPNMARPSSLPSFGPCPPVAPNLANQNGAEWFRTPVGKSDNLAIWGKKLPSRYATCLAPPTKQTGPGCLGASARWSTGSFARSVKTQQGLVFTFTSAAASGAGLEMLGLFSSSSSENWMWLSLVSRSGPGDNRVAAMTFVAFICPRLTLAHPICLHIVVYEEERCRGVYRLLLDGQLLCLAVDQRPHPGTKPLRCGDVETGKDKTRNQQRRKKNPFKLILSAAALDICTNKCAAFVIVTLTQRRSDKVHKRKRHSELQEGAHTGVTVMDPRNKM